MHRSILFPYNLDTTSQFSYFYAIELARKTNHKLKVVSTYKAITNHHLFFKRSLKNNIEEAKKQLHLKLLELNGLYNGNYNQWRLNRETKIKTLTRHGNIENVLLSLLKQKPGSFLLCDYKTFTEILLPSGFLKNISPIECKIWLMPQNIEDFIAKPELEKEIFEFSKKEIFGDLLLQTKLYNLPNDIHLIHSDFRSPYRQGDLIN